MRAPQTSSDWSSRLPLAIVVARQTFPVVQPAALQTRLWSHNDPLVRHAAAHVAADPSNIIEKKYAPALLAADLHNLI